MLGPAAAERPGWDEHGGVQAHQSTEIILRTAQVNLSRVCSDAVVALMGCVQICAKEAAKFAAVLVMSTSGSGHVSPAT